MTLHAYLRLAAAAVGIKVMQLVFALARRACLSETSVSEPSWGDAEQRSAGLPSARRERQERAAHAADTFASLYRAPASDATIEGSARRPAADPGNPRASGEAVSKPERRPSRRWGRLPARYGVLIITVGAGAGAFATIITADGPGTLLGVVLIAGALVGVLAVHPKAAYRLVPVPALAGFAAVLLAGAVHDRAADASRTEVALNALGWMSDGFVSITAATVVTLVVAVVRFVWHARRQRVSDDDFAHIS